MRESDFIAPLGLAAMLGGLYGRTPSVPTTPTPTTTKTEEDEDDDTLKTDMGVPDFMGDEQRQAGGDPDGSTQYSLGDLVNANFYGLGHNDDGGFALDEANIYNAIPKVASNFLVGNTDDLFAGGDDFDRYVEENPIKSGYNTIKNLAYFSPAMPVSAGLDILDLMNMGPNSFMDGEVSSIPSAEDAVNDEKFASAMEKSGAFDKGSVYRLKEITRLDADENIDVEDYPSWYNEMDIEGTIAGDYVADELPLTEYLADEDLGTGKDQVSYMNPYSERNEQGDKEYPLGLELADIMQDDSAPFPGKELSDSKFNNAAENLALRENLRAREKGYNDLLNSGEDTFNYRNVVKFPGEADDYGFYNKGKNMVGLGVDKETGDFIDDDVVDTILHEVTHQADMGNNAQEEIAVRRLMEQLSGGEDSSLKVLETLSNMSEQELKEYLLERKRKGLPPIPPKYLENILGKKLDLVDVAESLSSSGFNVSDQFKNNFSNTFFNEGGLVPPQRGPMSNGIGTLYKLK